MAAVKKQQQPLILNEQKNNNIIGTPWWMDIMAIFNFLIRAIKSIHFFLQIRVNNYVAMGATILQLSRWWIFSIVAGYFIVFEMWTIKTLMRGNFLLMDATCTFFFFIVAFLNLHISYTALYKSHERFIAIHTFSFYYCLAFSIESHSYSSRQSLKWLHLCKIILRFIIWIG